jgi:hypothetical protein
MTNTRRHHNISRLVSVAVASMLAAGLLGCHKKHSEPVASAPPPVKSVEEQWKEAADKVGEPRTGPIGVHATVDVPEELKHSVDIHRFLAAQLAESKKASLRIPSDFSDLAFLIKSGQLAEVPIVGDNYVLYGVGGIATDGPLTYYDQAEQVSIPIYATPEDVKAAQADAVTAEAKLQDSIASARGELKHGKGLGRLERSALRRQIDSEQARVGSLVEEDNLLDSYYNDPLRGEIIATEYKTLSELAANFYDKSYDLKDPAARLEFKVRLLGYLRPQAKTVMEDIASAYKKQFDRPLPVTSLVRTEEYQHQLSRTNPNAARNATPPHSTGLAFDIYYHDMDADEQNFLMGEIAKLKQAGKVEALRETRDHFHVFAYADGQPPPEDLIADSVAELAAAPKRSRVAAARRTAGGPERRSRSHRA